MQTLVLIPLLRSLRVVLSLAHSEQDSQTGKAVGAPLSWHAASLSFGSVTQSAGVAISMLYIRRLVAGIVVGSLTLRASVD